MLDMALDLILICSSSNIIILDVDNNSKKYILILSKCPMQGLDNPTIAAEEYSTRFLISRGKCLNFKVCIIMVATAYLFVNSTKINQFKVKNSEIKKNILCVKEIFKIILHSIT